MRAPGVAPDGVESHSVACSRVSGTGAPALPPGVVVRAWWCPCFAARSSRRRGGSPTRPTQPRTRNRTQVTLAVNRQMRSSDVVICYRRALTGSVSAFRFDVVVVPEDQAPVVKGDGVAAGDSPRTSVGRCGERSPEPPRTAAHATLDVEAGHGPDLADASVAHEHVEAAELFDGPADGRSTSSRRVTSVLHVTTRPPRSRIP